MQVNQIVKGKNAGTFLVLGFRKVGGEDGFQVKPVNPKDFTKVGRGEFWMPADSLIEIN